MGKGVSRRDVMVERLEARVERRSARYTVSSLVKQTLNPRSRDLRHEWRGVHHDTLSLVKQTLNPQLYKVDTGAFITIRCL